MASIRPWLGIHIQGQADAAHHNEGGLEFALDLQELQAGTSFRNSMKA
jgi:hypothetical protein